MTLAQNAVHGAMAGSENTAASAEQQISDGHAIKVCVLVQRCLPAHFPSLSLLSLLLCDCCVCPSSFTGFTSGLVNNRTVLLPIPVITATSPSYLNPNGRTWERVLSLTHQPSAIWVRRATTHSRGMCLSRHA